MKIFYLEDKLNEINLNPSNREEINDLIHENNELKMKIHENNLDLEQRNTLLVKAKGAIEALKGYFLIY